MRVRLGSLDLAWLGLASVRDPPTRIEKGTTLVFYFFCVVVCVCRKNDKRYLRMTIDECQQAVMNVSRIYVYVGTSKEAVKDAKSADLKRRD